MATIVDALKQPRTATRWRNLSGVKRREALWGLFFVSPFILGFILFYLLPMLFSAGFSLMDFTLTEPDEAHFIGLKNWKHLFTNDTVIWGALRATALFGFISLPISLACAIALALILNSENLLGKNLFRTLFYLPTMIPMIATVLIWNGYLNAQTGWLNYIIETAFGIEAIGSNGLRWLDDPILVYFGYTMMGLWGVGNPMLLTLASLQGVPTALYEAATVDGAGWWHKLRHITLPMISPIIFYNLVLGVVALMQYFLVPFSLNGTAPNPDGSHFFLVYLYREAFVFQRMGYGSALAWLLFVVGLSLTLLLFSTAKFWVYYAGDNQS